MDDRNIMVALQSLEDKYPGCGWPLVKEFIDRNK
jgi:hypothetical protein